MNDDKKDDEITVASPHINMNVKPVSPHINMNVKPVSPHINMNVKYAAINISIPSPSPLSLKHVSPPPIILKPAPVPHFVTPIKLIPHLTTKDASGEYRKIINDIIDEVNDITLTVFEIKTKCDDIDAGFQWMMGKRKLTFTTIIRMLSEYGATTPGFVDTYIDDDCIEDSDKYKDEDKLRIQRSISLEDIEREMNDDEPESKDDYEAPPQRYRGYEKLKGPTKCVYDLEECRQVVEEILQDYGENHKIVIVCDEWDKVDEIDEMLIMYSKGADSLGISTKYNKDMDYFIKIMETVNVVIIERIYLYLVDIPVEYCRKINFIKSSVLAIPNKDVGFKPGSKYNPPIRPSRKVGNAPIQRYPPIRPSRKVGKKYNPPIRPSRKVGNPPTQRYPPKRPSSKVVKVPPQPKPSSEDIEISKKVQMFNKIQCYCPFVKYYDADDKKKKALPDDVDRLVINIMMTTVSDDEIKTILKRGEMVQELKRICKIHGLFYKDKKKWGSHLKNNENDDDKKDDYDAKDDDCLYEYPSNIPIYNVDAIVGSFMYDDGYDSKDAYIDEYKTKNNNKPCDKFGIDDIKYDDSSTSSSEGLISLLKHFNIPYKPLPSNKPPPSNNVAYKQRPSNNVGYKPPPSNNVENKTPLSNNVAYKAPPSNNVAYKAPPSNNVAYKAPPSNNVAYKPPPSNDVYKATPSYKPYNIFSPWSSKYNEVKFGNRDGNCPQLKKWLQQFTMSDNVFSIKLNGTIRYDLVIFMLAESKYMLKFDFVKYHDVMWEDDVVFQIAIVDGILKAVNVIINDDTNTFSGYGGKLKPKLQPVKELLQFLLHDINCFKSVDPSGQALFFSKPLHGYIKPNKWKEICIRYLSRRVVLKFDVKRIYDNVFWGDNVWVRVAALKRKNVNAPVLNLGKYGAFNHVVITSIQPTLLHRRPWSLRGELNESGIFRYFTHQRGFIKTDWGEVVRGEYWNYEKMARNILLNELPQFNKPYRYEGIVQSYGIFLTQRNMPTIIHYDDAVLTENLYLNDRVAVWIKKIPSKNINMDDATYDFVKLEVLNQYYNNNNRKGGDYYDNEFGIQIIKKKYGLIYQSRIVENMNVLARAIFKTFSEGILRSYNYHKKPSIDFPSPRFVDSPKKLHYYNEKYGKSNHKWKYGINHNGRIFERQHVGEVVYYNHSRKIGYIRDNEFGIHWRVGKRNIKSYFPTLTEKERVCFNPWIKDDNKTEAVNVMRVDLPKLLDPNIYKGRVGKWMTGNGTKSLGHGFVEWKGMDDLIIHGRAIGILAQNVRLKFMVKWKMDKWNRKKGECVAVQLDEWY